MIFASVDKAPRLFFAVSAPAIPATAGGLLYDEDTGAQLYDETTGAPITA